MLYSIMGERIRDLRVDRDFTQKEIAVYLNCSQVCYSNYETGKRSLPVEYIVKLAFFYNVSTDYVFGLTDNKGRYSDGKFLQLRTDQLMQK